MEEEAVEEEAEEEPHNHNNPSRWPKMSGPWDHHPPSIMGTGPKPTTGSKN